MTAIYRAKLVTVASGRDASALKLIIMHPQISTRGSLTPKVTFRYLYIPAEQSYYGKQSTEKGR